MGNSTSINEEPLFYPVPISGHVSEIAFPSHKNCMSGLYELKELRLNYLYYHMSPTKYLKFRRELMEKVNTYVSFLEEQGIMDDFILEVYRV